MKLLYLPSANADIELLKKDKSKARILKDVRKALGYLETNVRHPSLNTHEFHGLKGPNNEKIFEAYAQNKTPGAYRILWYYGPSKNIISIIAIIAHP